MRIVHPGLDEAGEESIGGKGRSLALMTRAGLAVPPFFVVTAEAFLEAVGPLVAEGSIAADADSLPIPDALAAEIGQAVASLGPGDAMLAVRSSAVGEDSAELSYAGQLESYLFVRRADLLDCVRRVWASAFSERAIAYRRNNGVAGLPRVAVVVQKMIDAETAGVAFGIDPIAGHRDAVVISAVYGLGEGLVGGELDADTYVVRSGEVASTIAAKRARVVFDRAGGAFTTTEDLPPELRDRPVLDRPWIDAIAGAVRRLNALFGAPQDVEWCIADGRLQMLQSRPVTNLAGIPADPSGHMILWDNSNIIESYSGVTTPLTFTFVRDVYSEVYRELCRILGVDEETLDRNRESFEMLGLIRGRIYYNLLNWYRVLALLPGYSVNARFMEQMMGVRERLEETPSVIPSRRNPYLRLALSLYRLVANLISLPSNIDAFQAHLNATLSRFEDDPGLLRGMEPAALAGVFRMLERELLRRWRVPILNDFYTMIFFGLLKRVIEKWKLDEHGTLHNDLLSGEGGIISTEPPRRLRELSNLILAHPSLAAIIAGDDESLALRELLDHPEAGPPARDYLRKFGGRYVGELKLETITPAQDGRILVRLLAGYIRQGTVPGDDGSHAARLRAEAERRVKGELRGPFRRMLFRFLLRGTRARVRNRENLRFERTRVFAVVRELFLAIGARFAYEGIIAGPRDIFYLGRDEIFSHIEGTAISTDLRALIALRKDEFAGYEGDDPADRFATRGVVYHGNPYHADGGATGGAPEADGDLHGTPCSPGIVRGRIRKVTDPATAPPLDGAILVAERTDPGWAPLFPTASALLVERGSLLSHSAIVAREMGIPAIVGIAGLMRTLVDGEEVEMNGSAGTIRRLEREEER
jgi:pyruvate,water dikinase